MATEQQRQKALQILQQASGGQSGSRSTGIDPSVQAALDRAKQRTQAAPTQQVTAPAPQVEKDINWADLPGNIISSGTKFLKDTGSALLNVFNPDLEENTIANVGRVGVGAVQKLIPGEQKQEKYADAVVDFYKERYGGLDKAKETLINDPVGALADASALFTGAGGALRGVGGATTKAANIASKSKTLSNVAGATNLADTLTGVGRAATKVGQTIDPLMAAGRGVNRVLKKDPTRSATRNIFSGAGRTAAETLTGVESDVMGRWFQLNKKNPQKAQEIVQKVADSDNQPILSLVDDVAGRINNLRQSAQSKFKSAIDQARQSSTGRDFNLRQFVPKLDQRLRRFNLEVIESKKSAVTGGLTPTDDIIVRPTTSTSPYSPSELKRVNSLANKMRGRNLSVDDVLDFQESVRGFFDEMIKKDDKKMIALGSALVDEATRYVDQVLPAVREANDLYRSYYSVMDGFGRKIIDTQGNVKSGAESFLSNINNPNKGAMRRSVQKAESILGVNVLDEVQMIRDAQKLLKLVPNTVRNRTADFIRAIVNVGGAAGAMTGNFQTLVGPVLLNIASSPSTYRNVIEVVAGGMSKLKLPEAVRRIPAQELNQVRQLIRQYGTLLERQGRQPLLQLNVANEEKTAPLTLNPNIGKSTNLEL